MAGQFLVAHSSLVAGAGILAAGPYGCAQSVGTSSTPFFAVALAYNLVQAENGCMADRLSGLGVLSSKSLLQRANELASEDKIDPLTNLRRAKIYIYSGSNDNIVARAVVEASRDFFLAAGVPAGNVEFVTMPGGHAFLTDRKGNACERSDPPYVNDCHYDQAGAILSFVYGPLSPKMQPRAENFSTFNQRDYAARDASLADEGIIYVPSACRSHTGCSVHIVFHGCLQSHAEAGDAVTHESGFAEWAEANNVIILFPQAASSMLNPQSCWDWWGYTGLEFLTRNAPQIKSIEMMLLQLGAKPAV